MNVMPAKGRILLLTTVCADACEGIAIGAMEEQSPNLAASESLECVILSLPLCG
jgi:hypothetical protein